MRPLLLLSLFLLFLFFRLHTPNLFGQSYDENWDSRFNLPGVLGHAPAATFDEKGDLYVMGARTINGIRLDNSISRWNGIKWLHLMEIGEVITVAGRQMRLETISSPGIVVSAGRIYVAAELLASSTSSCVLVWNGSEWSIVGNSVMKGRIGGIRQYGNNLYIHGAFSIPKQDGDTIHGLARWDGTEWRGVEGATGISQIGDFTFDPFGSLYIYGSLGLKGEMLYGATAKWDGTEWTVLPPVSKRVMKIEVIGTALYVEGDDGVYRYDGTSWTEITAEMPEGYRTNDAELLAADDYGNLYVSVRPTAPNYGDIFLFRWNGAEWQQVPGTFTATPAASLYDIVFDGKGGFAVCGKFDFIDDSLIANNVGLWDGAKWTAPESGTEGQEGLVGEVASILADDGYLYVGGETLQSLRTPGPHGILRWSESKGWEEAGGGIDGKVRKIARDSAGNLYAAGCFQKADNAPARNIARWDGARWHPVGEGPDFCVTDIAVSGDTIYAVGGTALARWNGTGWERLADIGTGELLTVAAAADGAVYVGGKFDSAGGITMNGVARWRRGEWSALDGGMKIRYPLYVFNAGGPVEVHALLADGPYLYAAGKFDSTGMTPALNIARWDEKVWEALDSGLVGEYPSQLYGIGIRARVYGLMIYEGSLYATGKFYSAGSWGYKSPRRYNLGGGLARWDATNRIWTPLFDIKDPDGFYSMLDAPRTLAADGKWLYVGGDFLIAGSRRASYRIGRTTFPPSAVIERPIVGNDFYCGTSPVRRSTERTLQIVNPAGSNRTLAGRVEFIDGPFAPPYDPEFRIAPGDTVEFPIRFSPTVPGPATGTALIRHNATTDSTPIPIRLSGIGIPLDVNFTVEPDGIDFGEVVQSPYLTEVDTLFIRNHANSNSTISFRLEASPAAPLAFHWGYRTTMEDAVETNTLIPGEGRSYLIEMKAENVGDFRGTIVLSHDGEPGGEVRIPLHVTVVPAFARLNLSTDRIDFGEVPTGSTRFDTITIVADSRSNHPVYLNYSLVPELLPPFTVRKYGHAELKPGQSTSMILAFTPTSTGMFGDTLLLLQHINFVIDTLRIPLSGKGGRPIITAAQIELSNSSLDFGSVARNGEKEMTLTVTNPPSATSPLIISTTPPKAPFSAQRQRDLTLQPGQSTDLNIRFAPTVAGTFTDQLLIAHNADGTPSPLAVSLRGESRTSSVEDVQERTKESTLLIAEPNPAAGRTRIRFRAAAAGTARLSIHTTDGREVARLIDERIEAGERSIEWDTESVGSGIYLCRLKLGEKEETCLLVVP